jgi:hypothetical protein
MRRRDFITLLGGVAVVAWPHAARAQRAANMPTIGYLGPATHAVESQRVAAFVQRLRELGTPEFVHSYNEAIAAKAATPQGMLLSVLQAYQASGEFNGLAARTRFDYIGRIKVIETDFGDFPISALTDRRTRGIFMAWRDKLATKSRRQADYTWSVFARVLSWALDRGLVSANPCARGGRLYRGSRVDKIWTADDEAAFLKSAPAHFHLPLHQRRDRQDARSHCAADAARPRR